jgi:hypothetical protein
VIMSEITSAMTELPVQSSPTENDTDGGVVNPIGPLDSSMEPEEDESGEIPIEHLPDTGLDHEYSCNQSDGYSGTSEPVSGAAQPVRDDVSLPHTNCCSCLKKVARGLRCMFDVHLCFTIDYLNLKLLLFQNLVF